MLEAGQAAVIEHAERHLTTFSRVSQNVVTMVTLFDMLPVPSTDGVGKVYQRLKNVRRRCAPISPSYRSY
jgi:hypothetical protein